jgi:DNA modification methylase
MVFTSLPYYNKEIYTGTDRKSKKEWEQQFYIPIIEKTYSNLKRKGAYCLNIPIPLYEDIVVPLIGAADSKIVLSKSNRLKYKEYIYVWIKK